MLFLLFVSQEEGLRCGLDFLLGNSPELHQLVEHSLVALKVVEHLLSGNQLNPDNSVCNSLGVDNLDPADLGSAVAVGSATSLHVVVLYLNHSQSVSGNNSSLVKTVSVFQLGVLLVLESLLYLV